MIKAEIRAMLRLGLPLVAAQLLLFGTNVVDTLLAGHLGPVVLGAVAIGSSVWILPLMATQGMMFVVSPSVAQLVGAGQRRAVGAVFRQALWLAVFLCCGLGVMLRVGAALMVRALAVEADLAEGVVAFLQAIAWGMPALGFFMACRGLSEGLSLTRPTLWFGASQLVLLAPLGYLMMYGGFGIPAMGAAGCGLATALVYWIVGLAFLAYVAGHKGYRGIGFLQGRLGPDRKQLMGMMRLGVPMASSVVFECALFSGAAFAIGHFGAAAVAAHQVALNVAGFTFMVPLGLAGAVTVRVGTAIGRGDTAGARRAGLVGIGFSLVAQGISAVVMLSIPWSIAGLYSTDPDVLIATVALLGLAGLFQLSDGVQVAANGALRGMKDTRWPMVITLLAYWGVGFPIGLGLAFEAGLAAWGMWIGLLSGLSVAAVLLTWRFLRRIGEMQGIEAAGLLDQGALPVETTNSRLHLLRPSILDPRP